MKLKSFVAALVVIGLATSTMAVNARAKHHHKTAHSKSMTSKKTQGNGGGDTSSEGNVGPGTSNNNK